MLFRTISISCEYLDILHFLIFLFLRNITCFKIINNCFSCTIFVHSCTHLLYLHFILFSLYALLLFHPVFPFVHIFCFLSFLISPFGVLLSSLPVFPFALNFCFLSFLYVFFYIFSIFLFSSALFLCVNSVLSFFAYSPIIKIIIIIIIMIIIMIFSIIIIIISPLHFVPSLFSSSHWVLHRFTI